MSTIFALSTPQGRAGIAIIRLSGPQSAFMVEHLTQTACPPPRRAVTRRLSYQGTSIDHQSLILFFKGPASFSGEDMAEFHVHGSTAVVRSLSHALEILGAAPAEPGEFTKRAFLNGKLDLTEAEAIVDLIDAETSLQQAQALDQAMGGLSGIYETWHGQLLKALAHLEASIDFADEDLPADLLPTVQTAMMELERDISSHLADARRGERLRDGISIVITGPPNAGKSSLLNALAQREASIVTAQAGTTRDIIEVHLDLGGWPVILADTAGLRETDNEIEAEGIARARARAADADLRVVVLDATSLAHKAFLDLIDQDAIIVINKADLAPVPDRVQDYEAHSLSLKTGEGLTSLIEALVTRIMEQAGSISRPPPTRERHRVHLGETIASLHRFQNAAMLDLAAEDLRLAMRSLGRISGRVDTEQLLDVIFREFCIGK